jgi:hypothetical protein
MIIRCSKMGCALCCALALLSWRGAPLLFVSIPLYLLSTTEHKRFGGFLALGCAIIPMLLLMNPHAGVSENMTGILAFVPMTFPLLYGFLYLRKEKDPFLLSWLLYTSLLGMFMIKFVVLAVFPLALILVKHLDRRDWFPSFVFMSGAIFSIIIVFGAAPTWQTMECMESASLLTEGTYIQNDWDLGYWLMWKGANPLYTPLKPPKEQVFYPGGYVMTSQNLSSFPSCTPILNCADDLHGRAIFLYRCSP